MPQAACIGDLQLCPMFSGPAPHGSGPLTQVGKRTVLIGGRPAAIVGDLAICATGPPAQIVKGSASVMIDGRAAARVNDLTSHGGKITGPGAPQVIIGG